MTLQGSDPSLKSLVLNSHIDVVPVYEVSIIFVQARNLILSQDKWIHPPFAAVKDEGKIYARGSQV